MPWTCTDPMLERAKLVSLYHDGLYSAAELAERFSVSRFGRLQVDRAATERAGPKAGPKPSPTARTERTGSPHQDAARGRSGIVACRQAHPTWGPKKLLAYLARRQPDLALPACSTAGAILKRHRLTQPRRRRPQGEAPWTGAAGDQGAVRSMVRRLQGAVSARQRSLLLSANGHRRPQPVRARVSRATIGETGRRLSGLRAALLEHGLPHAIRTDNGNPFATRAIAGLSALNVWWIKLGIGQPAYRAGSSGAERPPRADASCAEDRDDQAARADDAGAAGPLRCLAARVQHRASARSTCGSHARLRLPPESASDAGVPTGAGVSSTRRGALGLECRDGPVQEAAVFSSRRR